MTTYIENNLENIRSKFLLMGQLATDSLQLAMESLLEGDIQKAKIVRKKDEEIDNLENDLSANVTSHLSTHAPVATDLRLLVSTMKASHEIERIGDEAKAIARRSKNTAIHDFNKIPEMGEIALEMIRDALCVFAEFDETKAKNIWTTDLKVDQLNSDNMTFCQDMVNQDPASSSSIFEMLFISKSLERIADHAVNISKEVVFMATSRDVRHEKVKKSKLKKTLNKKGVM
ncbi:MAG: phosphate transport system regulatory protein PhoU [Verrucomicrobiota bacterium]|nr:MAG: phosphate transport system regulatory protein PhoU [Verrucomicrobiota bacterium]